MPAMLHLLHIDTVIFGVSANKPYVDETPRVKDSDDHSIFVPFEPEDDPVTPDDAGSGVFPLHAGG